MTYNKSNNKFICLSLSKKEITINTDGLPEKKTQ